MRLEQLDPQLLAEHCEQTLDPEQHDNLVVAVQEALEVVWDQLAQSLLDDERRPLAQRLVLAELLQDLEFEPAVLVELVGRLADLLRITQLLAASAAIAGYEQPNDPQAAPNWTQVGNDVERWVTTAQDKAIELGLR